MINPVLDLCRPFDYLIGLNISALALFPFPGCVAPPPLFINSLQYCTIKAEFVMVVYVYMYNIKVIQFKVQ